MKVLNVNNISKIIKNIPILENINLTFEFGNIYGIKGKNGSGKTVLLKNICGLMRPSKGEILLDGKNYIKEDGFLSECGIIIEYPSFIKNSTGFDNLKYLAAINNLITGEEISNSMIRVGLNPLDRRKVKKYSLGMNQRLGIAQAIMENPNILILDEPTNSLDDDSINVLNEILIEYKKEGKLVLIASHDKEFLNDMCDKIYEIKGGKIV